MNDSISRQAAIETVKKHYRVDNDLLEVIAYEIEALPSAQLAQDLPNGCTDTISRVAALSALNGLTEIYLNNLPPTIYKADAVETVKALPSAQPGWISVTERLPTENNSYLVWMPFTPKGHHITVAEWCGSYWNIKTPIMAWMPLPKPPEGAQDGV